MPQATEQAQNDPHHGAAGVDIDLKNRPPPPLPCMRWFAHGLVAPRTFRALLRPVVIVWLELVWIFDLAKFQHCIALSLQFDPTKLIK
jgi:hypothetical protein